MGLYENVKEAAKSKGYSINRLEKELGFARSYISKFKNITPSADIASWKNLPLEKMVPPVIMERNLVQKQQSFLGTN